MILILILITKLIFSENINKCGENCEFIISEKKLIITGGGEMDDWYDVDSKKSPFRNNLEIEKDTE